jgi:hypothetical protein
MHDEGRLVAGIVILDEGHPFAELHIDLKGEAGIYRVNAELTILDESGDKVRVIKTKKPVIVHVPKDSDPGQQPNR